MSGFRKVVAPTLISHGRELTRISQDLKKDVLDLCPRYFDEILQVL